MFVRRVVATVARSTAVAAVGGWHFRAGGSTAWRRNFQPPAFGDVGESVPTVDAQLAQADLPIAAPPIPPGKNEAALKWMLLGAYAAEHPKGVVEVQGQSISPMMCMLMAVKADPTDADAWFNLGNFMPADKTVNVGNATGEEETAKRVDKVACLAKAAELKPDFAAAWGLLASVLSDTEGSAQVAGKQRSSTDAAREALALDRAQPAAWFALAKNQDSAGGADGLVEVGAERLRRSECVGRAIEHETTPARQAALWKWAGTLLSQEEALPQAVSPLTITTTSGAMFGVQECFAKSVEADPKQAALWCMLAAELEGERTVTVGTEALTAFECLLKAVAADSQYLAALVAIGFFMQPELTVEIPPQAGAAPVEMSAVDVLAVAANINDHPFVFRTLGMKLAGGKFTSKRTGRSDQVLVGTAAMGVAECLAKGLRDFPSDEPAAWTTLLRYVPANGSVRVGDRDVTSNDIIQLLVGRHQR